MKSIAYCLFDTELGTCGIAWSGSEEGAAMTALQIPEATHEATAARVKQKSGAEHEAAPPLKIAAAIAMVQRHLQGDIQDFRLIPVDLDEEAAFARRVYETIREIDAGQTMTYGEVAKAIGQPGAARAVGAALGSNPVGIVVPCHRVLAAGRKSGGFSAHGGIMTKAKLLKIEGAVGFSEKSLSLFDA